MCVSSSEAKPGANPLSDVTTYAAVVVRILLWLQALSLLVVTPQLQAVAASYAAPDIFVRFLGAAVETRIAKMGVGTAPEHGTYERLVAWWNS
jgi:hypothetical protein